MLIGIKDAAKLIGISVVAFCAVLVCAMFLNYYCDILSIEDAITSEAVTIFYNAKVSTAKVVCLASGGCLLITAVVMLMFYIKHYIDTHKKNLGILKALGYSSLKIAKNFWIFGLSTFIGAAVGFGSSYLLMPKFYELQNKDKILPEIPIGFHPEILVSLVLLPTLVFAGLAVIYAYLKLNRPVLSLINDNLQTFKKSKKLGEDKTSNDSFITDLRKTSLRNSKALVFFIFFASFCFSTMTQMSFSMKDLSNEMIGMMTMLIGLALAFTTLCLAITTVVNGNAKTIAMMRVFGYSHNDCCNALLGGYRPVSYIGFAIGTLYQYGLLRIMVNIVFKDVEGLPVYEFDFPVMIAALIAFIIIYETLMHIYSQKIKNVSVKEIMTE